MNEPRKADTSVSASDPLRRMRAYVFAEELGRLVWNDAWSLQRNPVTRDVAAQLFRAIGPIGANLAEGYSRSSGRDRVRLFEYALGSARECIVWYEMTRPVLGATVEGRLDLLVQIRRILLATIPVERRRPITRKSQ